MPSARDAARLSPREVVDAGLCIGCGGCAAQVPGARMVFNRHGQLQPRWPEGVPIVAPHVFARICPFSPVAADETALAAALFPQATVCDEQVGRWRSAWVGWAAEGGFRDAGSSGGMVSWVAAELLRRGWVDGVAHVAPCREPQPGGRHFRYVISRTEAQVRGGAKSRYYPVELSEVVAQIRAMPGRYAVVGIPCFIKAVQLLRREDPVLAERVRYTLGLFCGHMKSARLLESYAWQMDVPLAAIAGMDFRQKDLARPASWYTARFTLDDGRAAQRDWFHLAEGDWGSGFFQHPACDCCDDVVAETADIAFGDAWVEPYTSDGRGTNVVVVRSTELERLVEEGIADGRLQLRSVDADFVRRTQAAGLRQRREGLAYRLTWARYAGKVRKRVAPDASCMPRRKRLYRMRAAISAWSHRVYWIARALRARWLYLGWARAVLAAYHGLAYGRGRLGAIARWFGWDPAEHRG